MCPGQLRELPSSISQPSKRALSASSTSGVSGGLPYSIPALLPASSVLVGLLATRWLDSSAACLSCVASTQVGQLAGSNKFSAVGCIPRTCSCLICTQTTIGNSHAGGFAPELEVSCAMLYRKVIVPVLAHICSHSAVVLACPGLTQFQTTRSRRNVGCDLRHSFFSM